MHLRFPPRSKIMESKYYIPKCVSYCPDQNTLFYKIDEKVVFWNVMLKYSKEYKFLVQKHINCIMGGPLYSAFIIKETREEQKAGWLMDSQKSISISLMAKTSEMVKINIIIYSIYIYIGCSNMTIGQRKTDANRGAQ